MFENLERQPPDPILALADAYARDPRHGKIDLGIGVYRDGSGNTPIFAAVKAAEHHLANTQITKAYLGPGGNLRFAELLGPVVLGGLRSLHGLQTPGGTAAVKLGAELVARANPSARIWLGLPSWPNHAPIFQSAGLAVQTYSYFDPQAQELRFDEMMEAIGAAQPGDVVVLQACCHNPTGIDPSIEQWEHLADVIERTGAIALVDVAYQGLGAGLERDMAGPRLVVDQAREAIVTVSCSKNFGLYRERVGCLYWKAESEELSRTVMTNAFAVSRVTYSMPPDHGAAIVAHILGDEALCLIWKNELECMRERIRSVRIALANEARRSGLQMGLGTGSGMFAILPLEPHYIEELRTRFGIYMTRAGRINVAGLLDEHVPVLVRALASLLNQNTL